MPYLDSSGASELWAKAKAYFALKSHTHGASAITSGTIAVARLPIATTDAVGASKPDGTTIGVKTDGTIYYQGANPSAFLSVNPVGSIVETSVAESPASIYGGTWKSVPSMGGYRWERTAPANTTDSDLFLQTHPVGSIYEETTGTNPSQYGGTWSSVPSLGAYKWNRTA